MDTPLVTVVMPTRNTDENYLRLAIESILNQTYTNFEFIIIDDGSTGNDIEIVQSYKDGRIRLLHNEFPLRIPRTLNRGFSAAQGKYIARMDSDDISLPCRLKQQVAYLEAHPDIDILSARAQNFGAVGGMLACMATDPAVMKTALFFNSVLNHPSVMIRKAFLQNHSLWYDENYHYAEDYELFARCAFLGNIVEYPGILIRYRRHDRQISAEDPNKQTDVASRVRETMLQRLGISPNGQQMLAHLALCTEVSLAEISLQAISEWVVLLMAANEKTSTYDRKIFSKMIMAHYLVVCTKYVMRGRSNLRAVLSLEATREMLRPIYYFQYSKRMWYSYRVNKGRNNPRKE